MGLGLNSSLLDWAGLDNFLWAWILNANCSPGLGSNYRPVQGTSTHRKSILAVALLLFLLSTVLINVYLNVPNNSNSILY